MLQTTHMSHIVFMFSATVCSSSIKQIPVEISNRRQNSHRAFGRTLQRLKEIEKLLFAKILAITGSEVTFGINSVLVLDALQYNYASCRT